MAQPVSPLPSSTPTDVWLGACSAEQVGDGWVVSGAAGIGDVRKFFAAHVTSLDVCTQKFWGEVYVQIGIALRAAK